MATRKGQGPGRVEVRVECRGGAYAARVLRARAAEFLAALGQGGAEVSLLVTGDAGIRRINRDFRDKDEATDVLSFPSGDGPRPPGAAPFLGDLAISLDTARRRARADRRPLSAELARYLAHGLLHLLGHDHERSAREAARMAAAEARLLGGEGMLREARRAEPNKQRRLLARSASSGKGPGTPGPFPESAAANGAEECAVVEPRRSRRTR